MGPQKKPPHGVRLLAVSISPQTSANARTALYPEENNMYFNRNAVREMKTGTDNSRNAIIQLPVGNRSLTLKGG
jgi:hypothetical protein